MSRSLPRAAFTLAMLIGLMTVNGVTHGATPEPDRLADARAEAIDSLLAYAPRRKLCRPIKADQLASTVPQALAGIRCKAPKELRRFDEGGLDVRYYRFASMEGMHDWWSDVLATDPGGPWRNVGAHEFPIPADSGTLDICGGIFYAESWGETGWVDAQGQGGGRLVCWKGGVPSPRCDECTRIHPTLHWTVSNQLIGAVAAGTEVPSWRWQAHPGWQQADRTQEPGTEPHPPFMDSDELHPLPDWVTERIVAGDRLPESRESLAPGVAIPLVLGHCDDLSMTYDIDRSWWIPMAGADADGGPLPTKRSAVFEEGTRTEFLLVDQDTAQLQTPSGQVVEYGRRDEAIKRYACM